MAHMERIDPSRLSAILLNAPAWARVGLTVRNDRMRHRAADALAASILEGLEDRPAIDPDQMHLPI